MQHSDASVFTAKRCILDSEGPTPSTLIFKVHFAAFTYVHYIIIYTGIQLGIAHQKPHIFHHSFFSKQELKQQV